MPVIIIPTEESPFQPGPKLFPSVKVAASLSSMDTYETLTFDIPPSEHERSFGSDWAEAEVAQAAVQFSEYRQTPPEERTYKVTFDAYRRRGGEANDIEAEYQKLRRFVTTGPAPRRAHRLVFSQKGLVFRCYLKRVSMPVRRISQTGGALQALDCQITLVELHL